MFLYVKKNTASMPKMEHRGIMHFFSFKENMTDTINMSKEFLSHSLIYIYMYINLTLTLFGVIFRLIYIFL